MLKQSRGVSKRVLVCVLLALLAVAPGTMGAEPDPDPSWFEILQNWFEGLLNDDPSPTDPDPGTLHVPGG